MKSLIIVFLASFSILYSQNLTEGKKLLEMKQYEKAKKVFIEINSSGFNPQASYYLGTIYAENGKYDSAKMCFNKALEINPSDPLSLSGIAFIHLQNGQTDEFKTLTEKIKKLCKKNEEAWNALINACISGEKKDTALAATYINNAIKVNKKQASVYLRNGDLLMLKNNIGEAANQYKLALFYNKMLPIAHINIAKTYMRNFKEAELEFNKALEIDSTYFLIYKYLGDLYYLYGKYNQAEDNYKKYIHLSEFDIDDLRKYSFILFLNKNYKESEKILNVIMIHKKDDPILYRIRGYIAYENSDYANGLKYLDTFFKIQDQSKFIAEDYAYYGKLHAKNNNNIEAIKNLNAAIKIDSTKQNYFDELAKIYTNGSNYQKAIEIYSNMITKFSNSAAEYYFRAGKEYYNLGNSMTAISDSLALLNTKNDINSDIVSYKKKSENAFLQADTSLQNYIKRVPNSYFGYLWRGRILAALDPMALNDSAKISYEKALTILIAENKTSNKNNIIECYKYFGSYYYFLHERSLKSDKKAATNFKNLSIEQWKKVLELNPNDKQASDALELIKP